VQNFTTSEDPEAWDLAALHSAVRTIMPLPPTITSNTWANLAPEEIEAQVLELAEKNYEDMEKAVGSEELRQAEKQLMLQVVSNLWVRHLTALDALRQGIGLRAFGQQDPLVAFQKEAYEMYGQLTAAIQEEVVRRVYHPTIIAEAPRPQRLQAQHPDAMAASRMQAETPGATRQAATPVRVQKTPGRNDPCWCGSGKKYKHCHMKSDLAGGNGKSTPKIPAEATQASQGAKTRHAKKKKRARARRR
jgi:preprotein translocase subunit SecA